MGMMTLAALSGFVWFGIEKLNDTFYKTIKIEKPIPSYRQEYTNQQLKSLSESYNRRIYEEIKNAN